jgi:hypothetical protein
MDISAIGQNNMAMESQVSSTGKGIAQDISVAVMKQIQDNEKNQAQALIKMMENVPTPNNNGLGSVINIRA